MKKSLLISLTIGASVALLIALLTYTCGYIILSQAEKDLVKTSCTCVNHTVVFFPQGCSYSCGEESTCYKDCWSGYIIVEVDGFQVIGAIKINSKDINEGGYWGAFNEMVFYFPLNVTFPCSVSQGNVLNIQLSEPNPEPALITTYVFLGIGGICLLALLIVFIYYWIIDRNKT